MKKIITFFVICGVVVVGVIFSKNIIFKNILEKELEKQYGKTVSIDSANLGLINRNISVNGVKIENIYIGRIAIKTSVLDVLKNKDINIDTISINNFNIKDRENSKKVVADIEDDQFIEEINKKVNFKNNIPEFVFSAFNPKDIYNQLSENLLDFLVKNTDYIDIILEKQINKSLEKEKIEIKNSYYKIIKFVKENLFKDVYGKKIYIKQINVDGNIQGNIFSAIINNVTNDKDKAKNILISGELKNKNAQLYGEFDPVEIKGEFDLKVSSYKIEANTFLMGGLLGCNEHIQMDINGLKLDGRVQLSNLSLNKQFILENKKIDALTKTILSDVFPVIEKNLNQINLDNSYTTIDNTIKVKTDISNRVKSSILEDKSKLKASLVKDIEKYYSGYIKKKKEGLTDMFNKVLNIF